MVAKTKTKTKVRAYDSDKAKKAKDLKIQKAKEQQENMLNKLYDFVVKPSVERKLTDDDLAIEFFSAKVAGLPANFENKDYSGVNCVMLDDAMNANDINVPRFSTYNQAIDLIEKHKGNFPPKSDTFDPEKPLKGLKTVSSVYKWNVSFYENGKAVKDPQRLKVLNKMTYQDLEEREIKKYQGMKNAGAVFAIEDFKHLLSKEFLDSDPSFKEAEKLKERRMDKDKENLYFRQKANNIIKAMDAEVIEKEGSNRAFYDPNNHTITIPQSHRFLNEESRLAVIFHELSHSTAHPDILNRKLASTSKASPNFKREYSKEEIIAEMSTTFLTQKYGLNTFTAHANYIKGYADQVCANDNKKALIGVSSQAMKAANYIIEKTDAYELKLKNELDQKLGQDLKVISIVKNDNILQQSYKSNNNKEFIIQVDLNDFENVVVVNEKNLKEHLLNNNDTITVNELRSKMIKDLRDHTTLSYEVNREEINFNEQKRNEIKQESTNSLEVKKENKKRLTM